MSARIAVPGIVLGRYPEKRPRETPSWLRGITGLLRAGRFTQARGAQAFVDAVRRRQAALPHEGDASLQQRVLRARARLARDGLTDDALTEAFAVVSAACRHRLQVSLYDTQLFAARVMLDGQLAEMATGEGKTLAAAVAAATAALAGIPVHVVTANDYLAGRDAAALRVLYAALGLSVGAVTQPMPAPARRAAYACDITYCTAKELVFDYLRDSVAAPRKSVLEQRAAELGGVPAPQRLLRGLCMAIIDEADSILLDEARVPLVLSQAVADKDMAALQHAWTLSAPLQPGVDFHADAATRAAQLTAVGRERVRAPAAAHASAWLNARHCEDTLALALSARHLLLRGRDYVVEDGRVHIIDDTSGRKAAGRAWSQGLHQLVEIKERCAPSAPLVTLAQITYQRFFPRYFRLCGMSGTLREAARELWATYELAVVPVPLRCPGRRVVLPTRVFANAHTQWRAVAARARELHEAGRPLLVGTDSVLDSEALSRVLAAAGLPHAVLNARQDHREAQIVAAAGARGAITVATNMAGRGTDIVLDAASRDAGGLYVICCQQNHSRRIDRQLLGRCARQGDPGSVEAFVALDGPLLGRRKILKKLFKNKYLCYYALVEQALRQSQRAAERQARREREALRRRDHTIDDWFAFSGSEQ